MMQGLKRRAAVCMLAMAAGAPAHAQPAQPVDPNCPLPDTAGTGSTYRFATGRATILSAKHPGPLLCPGAGCQGIQVEVASFTREGGQDACCFRVQYRDIQVRNRTSPYLYYDLASQDGKAYRFTATPITFIPPPLATASDFDKLALLNQSRRAQVRAVNRNSNTFNYGLNIYRDDGGGRTLSCDANDPVIVNQGY